jgi:tetratricopeptide (TPR) repeat protein
MGLKYVLEVVRWLIAVGLGCLLFRWAGSKMNSASGFRLDVAFEIVIALLFYGLLLFALFGRSIILSVSNRLEHLFWPDDSNFRIMPEYSVAEARAKKGKYREAVDEYRKVIVKHPDDIYPHLRIADLALGHLNDVKLAELELLSAFAKAKGEDSTALAAGRLADFYQHTMHDPAHALEVMKQLCKKIPDTKQAKLAEERIAILEEFVRDATPPMKIPEKIALRPSRYKMPD